MMEYYKPYPSNDNTTKFYILTSNGRKIRFGAKGYKDYTIYYKEKGKEYADKKREAYIARHSKNSEKWGRYGINTSGFYARWLLWEEPTVELAYKKLREKLIAWGVV